MYLKNTLGTVYFVDPAHVERKIASDARSDAPSRLATAEDVRAYYSTLDRMQPFPFVAPPPAAPVAEPDAPRTTIAAPLPFFGSEPPIPNEAA